jgi:hypothetical protein
MAGKAAAGVALWLGFQKGDNIIEVLDDGSMFTDIHKNHFRQQFENYRMVSFWGDKDTVCSTTWGTVQALAFDYTILIDPSLRSSRERAPHLGSPVAASGSSS